jgi:hypothetical protein
VIPFFLPLWRSAPICQILLGILLAASLLRAVDRGPVAPATGIEPGVQTVSPQAQDRGQRPAQGNVVDIETGIFARQ